MLLVSQVCHRDLYMYLLALRSLARFLTPRKVYAIDDMSLSFKDKKVVSQAIPGISIIPIKEIQCTPCPAGGCWERLLFIADLAKTGYVIQMDCDTLMLKKPEEVIACIEARRSFTQGTYRGKEIVPMAEMWRTAKSWLKDSEPHVQPFAEANFDRIQGYEEFKYVRGCAGFAGFGDATASRRVIEEFSQQMERAIGKTKWSEWGSEQVTSNFVVANARNSMVLPFPKYGYFHKDLDVNSCTFIHFIGNYRFNKGIYASLGRAIIKESKKNLCDASDNLENL
ncbi:MAG: hypothetical protein ACREXR_09970 [Gammaproteobacteria bacterium]